MHRRVLAVTLAVMLVVAIAVGAWFGWKATQRTSYERAVASLPEATLRATYTDWDAVRRLARGTELGSSPTTRDVQRFLSRAYDQDLVSTSAVSDSTYALDEHYGFSPLKADWEMFGQSREGQVAVMRLGEGVDLDDVERNLRQLGYVEPDSGAGEGGVWAGNVDQVASIDSTLTPVMQNVVVLHDERLVLLSDGQAYASAAAEAATGETPSLEDVDGVSALAADAGSPATAVLYASDFACEALGMAMVDDDDRALADQLVTDAGGVSPLAGVVLAVQPDRSMVVGMHFESSDQASSDLRPRVELASGEAVGQGGTFADRFRVVEARADGSSIVMDLEPAEDDLPLLSDLSQGPVLFATC